MRTIKVSSTVFYPRPNRVDIEDIQENGLLLSDKDVQQIKHYFEVYPEKMRIPKKEKKFNYTIVKFRPNNKKMYNFPQYYAIYKGAKLRRLLGQGGYAKVKLMQNLESGEWSAYKIQKSNERNARKIKKWEDDVLTETKHLIRLKRIKYKPIQRRKTIPLLYEEQHIIEMTLASGVALSSFIDSSHVQSLSIADFVNFLVELLYQVREIHKKDILHLDLKPSNIIYDVMTNTITIIDFGMAVEGPVYYSHRLCGTKGYLAPELLKSFKEKKECCYNEKTELFALGKIIEELFLQSGWNDATVDAFIKRILEQNPKKRPTLKNVIHFFSAIQAQTLKVLGTYRHVAILDLEEWCDADRYKKELIIKTLCFADTVQLISTKKFINRIDYLKINESLRACGVAVNAQVIHNTTKNNYSPHAIADQVKRMNKNNQKNLEIKCFFVTENHKQSNQLSKKFKIPILDLSNKKLKEIDILNQVILTQKERILSDLKMEVSVLMLQKDRLLLPNLVKKRIRYINNFIKQHESKLDHKKPQPLTLIADLKKLEKNILRSGILAYILRGHFSVLHHFFASASAKRIRRLRKNEKSLFFDFKK